MILVEDAMVLIHLAKLSLLEKSCTLFTTVLIPEAVYQEIKQGAEKNYDDVPIITGLVETNRIQVKAVTNPDNLKKANQFNIFRGEAEAVALYWQEQANYLATDDDNVRKKRIILELNIIGTPGIIINLLKTKEISKDKFIESIGELRKIGWFSTTVLDTMLQEVEQ